MQSVESSLQGKIFYKSTIDKDDDLLIWWFFIFKSMEDLTLNYFELAFIMNIKNYEAKEIFSSIVTNEKVTTSICVPVKELKNHFGTVRSCDYRYDGKNELLFNLEHKRDSYKAYLNKKSFIKNKKFGGGAKIFYKILSDEQLKHVKDVFDYKYNFLFSKNS